MINTWSELFTTVKNWLETPLKFERKIENDISGMAIDELLKPTPTRIFGTNEWNRLQRNGLKKMTDLYFNHLRDRLRAGETLSSDELNRYKRYFNDPTRPRNIDRND